MNKPAAFAEYDQRVESMRRRLLAALNNPIRHTSDDMRTHISNLVRSAEAAPQRKSARPNR